MSPEERERLVNRIMSGRLRFRRGGRSYVIERATPAILYDADCYAEENTEDLAFQGWVTKKNVVDILVARGLWAAESTKNLEELEKAVEDLKVDLYVQFLDTPKADAIRKRISLTRAKQAEMLGRRHQLDHITVEGYADQLRQQYILAETLYENGTRLFKDIAHADYNLLNAAQDAVLENRLSTPAFRELARTDPWRSFWNTDKKVYDFPSCLMSEDQRMLIAYSKMYDQIHENPDAPAEGVINDDDAVDGWLIQNRRNNDKSKAAKQVDTVIGGRHKNADEVFVVAKSQEAANNIHAGNDAKAQVIKAQRSATIKKYGKIKETHLPDNVLKAQQQVAEKLTGQTRKER